VLQAIADLDYLPDVTARALRSRRSQPSPPLAELLEEAERRGDLRLLAPTAQVARRMESGR